MKSFTKDEIFGAIECRVCHWCENYKSGGFSEPCRRCNVSVIYQTFDQLYKQDK